MKPNGRRRWRKWLRRHTSTLRPHVSEFRRHWPPLDPLPATPFAARSLCGMSESAKKRAACVDVFGVPRWAPKAGDHLPDIGRMVAKSRRSYRIGERLRPCPGCKACGVRRFRKVGGFGDGTAYIEHRPGQCRMYRQRGKRWLFSPNIGRLWLAARYYPLSTCEAYVAAGAWEELVSEHDCHGSGVLLARQERTMR